jgi:hypothetical protein
MNILSERRKKMEARKILAILVLGLVSWWVSIAEGSLSVTVNNAVAESVMLEPGQTFTVEIVSDDSSPYDAYVGFDDGVALGVFSHVTTMPEAGDLNDVTEYNVPAFYGYYVEAAGAAPPPSAGVHFVFQYQAGELGETDLKLYDETLTGVIDSVHITVVADEVDTAFTYQGRLLDANDAADGPYDLRFVLYDAPLDGNDSANAIDTNEVLVIDGYFTVELDFGSSVYDGNAVWLEIGIRPGELEDPNAYTTLSPRQEVTATPYAMHTRGILVDSAMNVDIGGRLKDKTGFVMPVGSIQMFAGSSAPEGWLLCNGQAVSRATYSELFAVISTTYGSGDGSTTFNVPDLREAAPVGTGQRASGVTTHDEYTLGQFKDDQFQNITGTIGSFNTYAAIHGSSSGAFYRSYIGTQTGIGQGESDPYTYVHFNAANSSGARAGTTTRGKRFGVNFMIKH